MLRLPTKLALINALLFVVVVLSFSFYAAPFQVVFRQALYYFVALVSGHVMSMLTESRERALFLQRKLMLSAKRSAEEALVQVEESRREKERLIAAINHDLRQPMTAAVMHLDVLERHVVRRDLAGVAEQSRKTRVAIDLLGGSLDHVLNAADDAHASENSRLEHVGVASVLRTLRDTYAPQAERQGLQFRVRPPDERLVVLSNRKSLFRVLGNLISNALKFTPVRPDGTGGIVIAASVRHGSCRIDVIDNGVGIEAGSLDDIWQPYRQLNHGKQDRPAGLGLGLFLVSRIVDQLPGHQITVRSRPGRGTRFSVTLPCDLMTELEAGPSPLNETSHDEADLMPLNGAYVLLLEDDLEARLAIAERLEEWGVIVASGADLETLHSAHADSERMVDAIVSDYALQSGLNGLDAFDAIDEWLGYSPMRVLISGDDLTKLDRLADSPAVTVLRKPFSPSTLAGHLLAAVDMSRRLEAS